MKTNQKKQQNFIRRRARVRAKISGTTERPRLTIFKSHRYIYAQLVDDSQGHTLAAADSRAVKSGKPTEQAKKVGQLIALRGKAAKVTKVVFDRNGYIYGGKIKIVADAAREGGLIF